MHYRTALLGLVFLTGAILPSQGQDLSGTLKKIKDAGAITIGFRESSVPFSYYDGNQRPIGYAIDLCMKIVDSVKAELKAPGLRVNLVPVTPATRIPLIANGTIDLECGSTSNTIARQTQVAFSFTIALISKVADDVAVVSVDR